MDFILSALPSSFMDASFTLFILLLASVFFYSNQRRIRRLEAKLLQTQSMLTREIKMVNQGAIGVGRRFAQVEKKLIKASDQRPKFEATDVKTHNLQLSKASKFAQIQAQAVKPSVSQPKLAQTATQGLTTKAEQSLTSWLKEHQTA
ncbi:hypothetical protein [Reinekea sp.]|jgi:hypothetical protein|uniref:hypothetical protein n=1 Tax=Reinekea sp. TaxID=1970455 RepID=UPI003988E392